MLIPPKELVKILVKEKTLTQEQADRYELESLKNNIPLDKYLINRNYLPKQTVAKAISQYLNISYINVDSVATDPQALSFINESLANKYKILPIAYNQATNSLQIATANPNNFKLIDFLEKKTGKRVIPVFAYSDDIKKAINTAYNQTLSPYVKAALKEVAVGNTTADKVDSRVIINQAPITKIVNTILEFAMKSRASDVHIEPMENKSRVRYRIDGILEEKLTLPKSIHDSLVSRIKILSGMKIDEKRIPQDGRFTFRLGNKEVDLRVSSLPTTNGEKIVMRLLKKTGGMPSLFELGLRGTQLKHLEEAVAKPYGIILITGPTGSGKTTTLYSILSKLNKPGVNIMTLEDPVEYQLAGINQVQINPQAGLTFANGLRAFLRQDPNIILVGEIRDKETTQLAIQSALTGHLVLSTLHTNDSATSIPRLIDLGGEPFLISSVLNAVVAQRIVRRVCKYCQETYEPPAEIQKQVKNVLGDLLPQKYKNNHQPIKLSRGKGCNECNFTGYYGRIGIFEVLKISPAINKMILREASAKEIEEKAREEGLTIMKQDGYLKALEGITTLEEVLRVAEV